MGNIFEYWLKLWSEPITLRRLIVLISFIFLGFCSFVAYERYTTSFRLARLQKSVELLKTIQELPLESTNATPELVEARKVLLQQTLEVVKSKPLEVDVLPARLAFEKDSLLKALAGGALLFVSALITTLRSKEEDKLKASAGHWLMAGIGTLLAALVPAFWWPWFHILFYPWLFFVGFLVALVPFALLAIAIQSFSGGRAKAQSIACASNLKQIGLGARLWAQQHKNRLPIDFPSMINEIGSKKVLSCPCDPGVPYEILSPGAEVDPDGIYAHCPTHGHVLRADGTVDAKFGRGSTKM